MKSLSDPQLYRRTLIGLALAGAFVSLIAPGWVTCLIFAGLIIYIWRFPPPVRTAPHAPAKVPPPRSEPPTYRIFQWKGMIFRSKTELRIAKTLDHRGIFFIPPTHVRLNASKNERQSRELDFVICHEGKWGVLEVDGPYHNTQYDAERDRLLGAHGITNIQRFDSKQCFSQPNSVVDEFLNNLK